MDLSWRRVGAGLAGAGIAGALAALVAGDLLPIWWWSEIWQHPRPQLAVVSLCCALAWSLLRQSRWRWCSLLVPLWAFAGMLPALFGGAMRGAGPVIASVVTANVHSSNPDPAAAVATIHDLQADIVIVLEPDLGWSATLQALRDAYPVHRELLRDDNFGICAYARRGTIEVWQPDGVEVPGLVVHCDGVEVLGIHPPPPFSAEYYGWWRSELAAVAAWSAGRPAAVVAGDLNATPWSSGYRRLCRDGRLQGPGGMAAWSPTWMRATPLAAPIDHILVGSDLGMDGHAVGPDLRSDHQPVLVRLRRR